MSLRPLPLQKPVPIWIGGQADAVLRRVAALGDGWLPLIEPDDEAPVAIARLHEFAREAGRDPASIPIEGAVYTGGKTPDQWRRDVAAWQEMGASSIMLYALNSRLSSVRAYIEMMEAFKEAAGVPFDA